MKLDLIARLRHARRVSVPLVNVNTADQLALIKRLTKSLNGDGTPVVAWDILRGCWPVNEAGRAVARLTGEGDDDVTVGNPAAMLSKAREFPANTIAFMVNMDQYLKAEDTPAVVQGVANLRDEWKQDGRMLVMLAPSLKLPVALKNDIVVIEDPLPEAGELRAIVEAQDAAATDGMPERPRLTDEQVARAVEAVQGLSAFEAEQAVAMALRKTGVDMDHLWESKRTAVSQVAGLSVDRGNEQFDDIGGLEAAKRFGRMLFNGRKPPRCVVRMEELEKAMGGAVGDTSGTSQDALQVMLTAMEDYGWGGMLAFGPPGSGKSMFSKSLANTFDRLPLVLDINACKGSLVGQSEQQIRAAVKTMVGIGGRDVFFIASVNKIGSLRPELLRRFRYGIWMFDLPDAQERERIWSVQRAAWNIPEGDPGVGDDEGWSGADVRNCCELAYSFGCTLAETLPYLVQNGRTLPETIDDTRKAADGRFLSASYPGVYRRPMPGAPTGGRAVRLED